MLKLSLVLAAVGLALLVLSSLPAPAISIAQAPPIAAPTVEVLAGSSQIAYGKALFSDKGCVACHHHAAVAGSGTFSEGNPDLTADRWSADHLRAWLQNPAAVKPDTSMPNLGLRRDEIEALVAFLSSSN